MVQRSQCRISEHFLSLPTQQRLQPRYALPLLLLLLLQPLQIEALLLLLLLLLPSAVKSFIATAGGEADEDKLSALMTDLEGKSIHELLAKGETSLKSCVGAAGGGG